MSCFAKAVLICEHVLECSKHSSDGSSASERGTALWSGSSEAARQQRSSAAAARRRVAELPAVAERRGAARQWRSGAARLCSGAASEAVGGSRTGTERRGSSRATPP